MAAWEDVRIPAGRSLFDQVESDARNLPLKPKRFRCAKYCEFLSYAGHLQRLRPQPIQLPVRRLAKKFSVSEMTISNYRQWAIDDGFLKETQVYSYSKKLATEFRFVLDRFDWNTGSEVTDSVDSTLTIGSHRVSGFSEAYIGLQRPPRSANAPLVSENQTTESEKYPPNPSIKGRASPMTDEEWEARKQLLKEQLRPLVEAEKQSAKSICQTTGTVQ